MVNLHQAVLAFPFPSYFSSLFQILESLGHGEIKGINVTLLRTWSTGCVQCGLNVKYHPPLFLVLDFYGMQFFLGSYSAMTLRKLPILTSPVMQEKGMRL